VIQPKGDGTTHASTRRIEEPALAPMPTPADDLAQLLAAVLAHRPQPRAWPRPRPPYLPHPRRRLPRIRGGCGARRPGALHATQGHHSTNRGVMAVKMNILLIRRR
jgi:hypothetical protein